MNQHPATWAWAQDLKGHVKLILLALADHSGDNWSVAFSSMETLAEKTGLGRTSVYNAIKKLAEGGFISIKTRYEEGRKVSNFYTLNLDLSSDVRTKKDDLSSDVRTKTKTPEKSDLSSDLSSKLSSNLSSDVRTVTTIKNQKNEPQTKGEVQGVNEVNFPDELDTDSFKAQWLLFERYRRENKMRALKPSSVQTKLSELAEWGHDTAIEAIRQTIGNGWQGIFPPKSISSKPRAEGATQPKESSAQKSPWELKQQLEAIEERMNELKKRRAEVAGGDYVWDNQESRREFYELCKKRKTINAQRIAA